jgi:hypothetical protein
MNKAKVVLRGPLLSRSGYGEQARFALRSLKSIEDDIDIYVRIVGWGATSWTPEQTDEKKWINELAIKTVNYEQQGPPAYDVSLQVTIPNEWERLAPFNVGYTAGIESTAIAPQWITKANLMDRIIVTSNHSKFGFDNSSYSGQNPETGEVVHLETTTPIIPVGYPVRKLDTEKVNLKLDTDFNFLSVAQWSVRKNLENTIEWFIKEFKDEEVGLILKANCANNSNLDRIETYARLERLLSPHKDRKCKVYLIHGDMTDQEMLGLYAHPKVKALINFAHGEGFGLPLFEAAQCGLPIVATDWSGHTDFLYVPTKNKKGKTKIKGLFGRVSYDLAPIQKSAHWDGVLIPESEWAYPRENSARSAMRDCFKDHPRHKSQAKKLKTYINKTFTEERQYKKFIEGCLLVPELPETDYIFVNDMFANEYAGGAELSLQTLIDLCPAVGLQIKSAQVSERLIDHYGDKTWVFANVTQITDAVLEKIAQSGITYYVSESDYKYCERRLPQLCKVFSGGQDCTCGKTNPRAKLYEDFYNSAQTVFFRSSKQMADYKKAINLTNKSVETLSALFSEEFFKKVEQLKATEKTDRWIISSSPSWVKGAVAAEQWCRKNNKNYEKVHGLKYDKVLELLAASEGLCFLPKGSDTCPRLVIEAKLLGCKLELNDNVLHAEEEWFKTDDLDQIKEHLLAQPKKFWDIVTAP